MRKRYLEKNICLFISLSICFSLFACENRNKAFDDSFDNSNYYSEQIISTASDLSDGKNASIDHDLNAVIGFWRENNDFGCTWFWGDNEIVPSHKTVVSEEIDIVHPTVREFMNSPLSDGEIILDNYYRDLKSFQVNDLDGQNLCLSWDDDGSAYYNVCIADNPYYKNSFVKTVTTNSLSAGICIPGNTYYYKVLGGLNGTTIIKEGAFKAKDANPRIIDIDGTHNVRDIGGYITEEGKKVNYGLLYRGAELNGYKIGSKLTTEGKSLIKNTLGIKTEIDLRGSSDDGGQTACEFGGEYLKESIAQYYWLIPENNTERIGGNTWYDGNTSAHLKNIFARLANKDNYPFYFHCNWGRDRTGTLAFLLNGLLGVSYDDLIRDWELTTFWYCYGYPAIDDGSGGIGTMKRMLMQYYGVGDGKLSSAIENYLVNAMDVPQEHIDSFRSIMTGGVETVDETPVSQVDFKDRDGNGIKLVQQISMADYEYLSRIFDVTIGALFVPSDMLSAKLDLSNTSDKILNVVADYPYKNAYKAYYEFRTSLTEIPESFSGEISVVGYISIKDKLGKTKIFYSQKYFKSF